MIKFILCVVGLGLFLKYGDPFFNWVNLPAEPTYGFVLLVFYLLFHAWNTRSDLKKLEVEVTSLRHELLSTKCDLNTLRRALIQRRN